MYSGQIIIPWLNATTIAFNGKISFRPKRHKLSTNSNPMAFVGEGGIELTDATAAFIVAKEDSVNGGAHKRHQNNGSGDEEETKALKANVEVVEI